MGWKKISMEQQKMDFIEDVINSDLSFSEICYNQGISRKTGYKWFSRFLKNGQDGLKELSRAPHAHPNAIDEAIVEVIISIKTQFKYWGPRKVHRRISTHYPDIILPSKSTVENILKANNLTGCKITRRRVPATAPLGHCNGVNEIWCKDFKGWFLTRDGKKCEPLTITDAHSRYLLKCVSMKSKTVKSVWNVLDAAFREYGLPLKMRSDNGPPFATTGVGRLSRLSVMLIKAGVTPEWITPGKPQENGRHERFHGTLKKETASPPALTLTAQEQIFKEFQAYYNNDRPHEALDMKVPADVYVRSPRQWDGKLRSPEYDDEYEKRKVMKCGTIGWLGKNYFISETLYGEYVGLKQIDTGKYDIYFGGIVLGCIDVRKGFKKKL